MDLNHNISLIKTNYPELYEILGSIAPEILKDVPKTAKDLELYNSCVFYYFQKSKNQDRHLLQLLVAP